MLVPTASEVKRSSRDGRFGKTHLPSQRRLRARSSTVTMWRLLAHWHPMPWPDIMNRAEARTLSLEPP